MPILAGAYPVVRSPEFIDPFADSLFADSRYLSFRSLDGQTILPCTGDEFIATWGMQGMDVPKREPIVEQIPGSDGAELVDVNIGSREVFLPMFLGSNSGHRQYLADRAALRALFNYRRVDYRREGGTFDLVGTSVLGDRSLRCFYQSGMDGDWEQDSSGSYFEGLGLKLLAVRPYWSSGRWSTPVIRRPSGARWFGRFPGRLASSRALGQDILVTVPGDADSWPVMDLSGPASSVEIAAAGFEVSIPGGLAEGEPARVVTRPGSRTVLFGGVKDWSRVGPTTRWRPLSPGDQMINIDVAGAGTSTFAQVSGDTLFETPW